MQNKPWKRLLTREHAAGLTVWRDSWDSVSWGADNRWQGVGNCLWPLRQFWRGIQPIHSVVSQQVIAFTTFI